MRLRGAALLALLALAVCLSVNGVTGVFAQDSGGSGLLASLLDQTAAAYGLPTGDGAISPAEQSVAGALVNDINGFNQVINDFEQASPANSVWADAAEQAAQQFDQQVNSIPANETDATRVRILENAIAQYGQTADTLNAEPSAPVDPGWQMIHNAVEQYGVDTDATRVGILENAIAQYGVPETDATRVSILENAIAQYGQQKADPNSGDALDAIEQYLSETADKLNQPNLSPADLHRVVESIHESANQYIDQSGVRRPGITKRHINHLVQIMIPNAQLPTNGYWRILPYSMTTSGHCLNLYGDNDGPSANDNSNPGQPLCGYANKGMLPYILWGGNDIPYLPGSSSIYSQAPSATYTIVRDTNGKSTGSIKMTTTVEYEVVAANEIHVHLFIHEDGGCSMNADYIIQLVTADESVCPKIPTFTVPDASTPQPSTPQPTTPEPTTPEPEQTFHVGAPIITDPKSCNENNTPPNFDQVRLVDQHDGSVVIDYGSGQQTLYADGDNYYEYDSGMSGAARQDVSLVFFDGGGSISWSINSKDGNICFVSHDLTPPNAPVSTPVPSDNGSNSGDSASSDTGDANSGGMMPGDYAVTWAVFPGMDCPADLQAKLPNFADVTLAANGADYTLDGAGTTYPISLMGNNYSYMDFAADNSGVVIALSPDAQTPGHLTGSYTYFAPDGTACLSQLDFAPKP